LAGGSFGDYDATINALPRKRSGSPTPEDIPLPKLKELIKLQEDRLRDSTLGAPLTPQGGMPVTQRRIDYLLDTLPDRFDQNLVHEATPERIEQLVGYAEAERHDLEATVSWLREFQAVRATQVMQGTWPPKAADGPEKEPLPAEQYKALTRGRMSIHSKPGTKVRFSYPNSGWVFEQEQCGQYLTVGETYTVKQCTAYDSHSTVVLEEVRQTFNTVFFAPADSAPPTAQVVDLMQALKASLAVKPR
jgi:hypothetical protein